MIWGCLKVDINEVMTDCEIIQRVQGQPVEDKSKDGGERHLHLVQNDMRLDHAMLKVSTCLSHTSRHCVIPNVMYSWEEWKGFICSNMRTYWDILADLIQILNMALTQLVLWKTYVNWYQLKIKSNTCWIQAKGQTLFSTQLIIS